MDTVCRTCMRILDPNEPVLSINDSDIREKLNACYPELVLDKVLDPKMCSTCSAALSLSFRFKGMCNEAEKSINYCINNKSQAGGVVKPLNKVELLKIGRRDIGDIVIGDSTTFLIGEEVEVESSSEVSPNNIEYLGSLQILSDVASQASKAVPNLNLIPSTSEPPTTSGDFVQNWEDEIESTRIERQIGKPTISSNNTDKSEYQVTPKKRTVTEAPSKLIGKIVSRRNTQPTSPLKLEVNVKKPTLPVKVLVETIDVFEKTKSPLISNQNNQTKKRARTSSRLKLPSRRNKRHQKFVHTTGEDELMHELSTVTTVLEPENCKKSPQTESVVSPTKHQTVVNSLTKPKVDVNVGVKPHQVPVKSEQVDNNAVTKTLKQISNSKVNIQTVRVGQVDKNKTLPVQNQKTTVNHLHKNEKTDVSPVSEKKISPKVVVPFTKSGVVINVQKQAPITNNIKQVIVHDIHSIRSNNKIQVNEIKSSSKTVFVQEQKKVPPTPVVTPNKQVLRSGESLSPISNKRNSIETSPPKKPNYHHTNSPTSLPLKKRIKASNEAIAVKTPTKTDVDDVTSCLGELLKTPEYQKLLKLQATLVEMPIKSEFAQKLHQLETVFKDYNRSVRKKEAAVYKPVSSKQPHLAKIESPTKPKLHRTPKVNADSDLIEIGQQQQNEVVVNKLMPSSPVVEIQPPKIESPTKLKLRRTPKVNADSDLIESGLQQQNPVVVNKLMTSSPVVETQPQLPVEEPPVKKKRPGKKRVSWAQRVKRRRQQIREAKKNNKVFYKIKDDIDGRSLRKKQPLQTCEYCGKVFQRLSQILIHKRTHSFVKSFTCVMCGKGFTLQRYLLQHTMQHFSAGDNQCSICEKYFSSSHVLKKHQVIHTGERPFECKTCGRGFNQRSNLRQHNFIHTGERDFVCDLCNSSFKQKIHLVGHIRTHTGEKPFACDLCPKTYAKVSVLKHHKELHDAKPFMCNHCHSLFKTEEILLRHIKRYKRQQEYATNNSCKVYNCGICSRYFTSQYSRDRHMKVHVKDLIEGINTKF